MRRRHKARCPSKDSPRARCDCSYETYFGPRRARQTATHATFAAAESWLRDARAGKIKPRSREPARTLREHGNWWLAAAARGAIRTRSGRKYKPSTLRGYALVLRSHVYPAYGDEPVDEIRRGMLNRLARELSDAGKEPSTVRNILMPVRAIYRTAVAEEDVDANPTTGMAVPAGSGRRMRFLTVTDIVRFLRALQARDQPLWATAIYGGLRRGELMGLRWSDVDLAGGTLFVHEPVDAGTGETGTPKSEAGDRRVPICAELREFLLEHRARAGAQPRGFVCCRGSLAVPRPRGRRGGHRLREQDRPKPFTPGPVGDRAKEAAIAAGLAPVTLHDCRHTFASLTIKAMVDANRFNPKALQEIMGHASIQITYDRYGHLFPGTESEVGEMLDTLLAGASVASTEPADNLRLAADRLRATLGITDSADALPVVSRLIADLDEWSAQTRRSNLLPSVSPLGDT